MMKLNKKCSKKNIISSDVEKELLKNMIWLRMCEENIVTLYNEQQMRTPCHFATERTVNLRVMNN